MSMESIEDLRRAMLRDGIPAADLADAQSAGEQTWDTEALKRDFEVLGFSAPVHVNWDDGSTLGMVEEAGDRFTVVGVTPGQ